jgi:ABC-2 type transport system ATP-binding protein
VPSVLLRTERLTKRFGDFTAVEDVGLEVFEGDLYGFLGLNGAGKTTTIRMLVRLIRPTAGRVELFGVDAADKFLDVMNRMGAMVEIPAFYPYLTGRENLELLRRLAGFPDRARVDEVLELVGLGKRGGDRVKAYSQGMRQRLGIAQALLTRPRFVILDEPTNGLDPQGIADIRGLIQRLNRTEGITFLISSHQLHEIELICTRVGIIREGRLVRQGGVRELLDLEDGYVRVRAVPGERAAAALRGVPMRGPAEQAPDGAMIARVAADQVPALAARLLQERCAVSVLPPRRLNLEELFLSELQGAGTAGSREAPGE